MKKIIAVAAAGKDNELEHLKCWNKEIIIPCDLARTGVLKAYHMNKQHWNTIILSDKCDTDLIKELLEQSYESTKK